MTVEILFLHILARGKKTMLKIEFKFFKKSILWRKHFDGNFFLQGGKMVSLGLDEAFNCSPFIFNRAEIRAFIEV